MRYISTIILGVVVMAGLLVIVNITNHELLDNYLNEFGEGYVTGVIGMIIHYRILLKWYKKEL